jgi:hypothetical protein
MNKRPIPAWLPLITIGLAVTLLLGFLFSAPRLLRIKDPSAVDPSDGLIVIMNPLRERASEATGDDFLRRLREGPCESSLSFMPSDRRAEVCERERAYRIVSWKLRDREGKGDQVRLFYSVYRRPMLAVPTNVWVTVALVKGKWCPSGLTRRSTCRGPASARRPSRLVKSKSERRRAACIARLTCRQAVRRAAVATWALAAQVNV